MSRYFDEWTIDTNEFSTSFLLNTGVQHRNQNLRAEERFKKSSIKS